MAEISRRRFVEAGGLAAAAAGLVPTATGEVVPAAPGRVDMTGDGPELSPAEYASLLARLLADGRFEPDDLVTSVRDGPAEDQAGRYRRAAPAANACR